ncbi:hypothetical protein CVT24_009674 [Panaeolus cyanescens]|uniref:BTB domain-containing protein n=1 Tax=Panaeolus cyanescens TaxID=181874 RepID=A0A409Y9Y6_9AGAR|nr:hypothetical protein CVT24_009674 [Panaeolus cyanescens]
MNTSKIKLVPKSNAKATSPEAKTIDEVERDDMFYYETVVLKVESTLFCIPKKSLAKKGTFFEDLFNGNAGDSKDADLGSSDANPLVLQGVSKEAFRDFLKLVSPFARDCLVYFTEKQWLNVLWLAKRWKFDEVKEKAMSSLDVMFSDETTDPIQTIVLCKQYDVDQWLPHCYERLITQKTPLDRDGMLNAGVDEDTVNLVYVLRDRWLTSRICTCLSDRHAEDGDSLLKVEAEKFVAAYLDEREAIYEDGSCLEEEAEVQEEVEAEEDDEVNVKEGEEKGEDEDEVMDSDEDQRDCEDEEDVPGDAVENEPSLLDSACPWVDVEDKDDEDSEEEGSAGSRTIPRTLTKSASDEKKDTYRWAKLRLSIQDCLEDVQDTEQIRECILDILDEVGGLENPDNVSFLLQHTAGMLFNAALNYPSSSHFYADFCKEICSEGGLEDMTVKDTYKNCDIDGVTHFKRKLFRFCQIGFKFRVEHSTDPDSAGPYFSFNIPYGKYKYKSSGFGLHCNLKQCAIERRMALIRFIGNLYLLDFIYRKTMRQYIRDMYTSDDDIDIECLAYLLGLIGKEFDDLEDDTFQAIQWLIQSSDTPPHSRYLLKDIIKLRESGWKGPSRITIWRPSSDVE